MTEEQTDYEKYRGKCKEATDALCEEDPTLTQVRGFYHCPFTGKQEHWWCTTPDGEIVDPTKKQFPAPQVGEYEEFNGTCECAECGKEIAEEDAIMMSRYLVCSDACAMRLVGL